MTWQVYGALLRRIMEACERVGDWWDISTVIQPSDGHALAELPAVTYVFAGTPEPIATQTEKADR